VVAASEGNPATTSAAEEDETGTRSRLEVVVAAAQREGRL